MLRRLKQDDSPDVSLSGLQNQEWRLMPAGTRKLLDAGMKVARCLEDHKLMPARVRDVLETQQMWKEQNTIHSAIHRRKPVAFHVFGTDAAAHKLCSVAETRGYSLVNWKCGEKAFKGTPPAHEQPFFVNCEQALEEEHVVRIWVCADSAGHHVAKPLIQCYSTLTKRCPGRVKVV